MLSNQGKRIALCITHFLSKYFKYTAIYNPYFMFNKFERFVQIFSFEKFKIFHLRSPKTALDLNVLSQIHKRFCTKIPIFSDFLNAIDSSPFFKCTVIAKHNYRVSYIKLDFIYETQIDILL